MSRLDVAAILDKLHGRYGDPPLPPTRDPFQLVLWEQVAYLANHDRRRAAFDLLAARVGVRPADLISADLDVLEEVTGTGGSIAVKERAERMRWSARLVMDEWDGDLESALGDEREAHAILTRFPMIGRPGADKILLLSGLWPALALDSNGCRVALRLGYGLEESGYSATYRNVTEALAEELPPDRSLRVMAYGLLRRHGQMTCRTTKPECDACPLRGDCPWPNALSQTASR